jgi:hypothetical protein
MMGNFAGMAGGMGGGMSPAAGALNLANRMGDRAKGMAKGGEAKDRLTYKSTRDAGRMSHGAAKPYLGGEDLNKKQTTKPAEEPEDQSWFKPMGSFAPGGNAGAQVSNEAMQQISRLMQPGPDEDPFAGLQGYSDQTKGFTQTAGSIPHPHGGAYHPGQKMEHPIIDLLRSLDRVMPLIARGYAATGFNKSGMGMQPIHSTRTERGNVTGFDVDQAERDPSGQGPNLQNLPIMPGPWEGHPTHESTPHSIRAGRTAMAGAGQKRGGVAKKALALAKRRKKGSRRAGGRA